MNCFDYETYLRLYRDGGAHRDVAILVRVRPLLVHNMHFVADPKRGICVATAQTGIPKAGARHYRLSMFDFELTELIAEVLNAAAQSSGRWVRQEIAQAREAYEVKGVRSSKARGSKS